MNASARRDLIFLEMSSLCHLNQRELPSLEIKNSIPVVLNLSSGPLFDDKGAKHMLHLRNVLFFPDSPVNVLSVTALANQLDDSDGTWIRTQQFFPICSWDNGKF